MSIHYDSIRKTYMVRWTETNTLTGEKVRRAKRGFPTKKDARRFEDDTVSMNEYSSFYQLSEHYIDSLKGYANDETIEGKRALVKKYCQDLLPLNVRDIKKDDIIKFKNYIHDTQRSLSLKNKIIRLVKAISKFGWEYYEYPNFALHLKAFPKTSDDVKEMNVISISDFENIVQNVSNDVYRRLFIFLYHTGMRRGEALALQKSDVQGKYVSINKSIRRSKTSFKSLKNPQSKRTILLDDVAYESIKPLLETQGGFLFGEFEALSPTTITRYFNEGLDGAGLPHYRIHDLRHSFVSNAILNGIDIVSVSKYVGHSDIERTLNTYSHLLKDSEIRMIDSLNSMFKSSKSDAQESHG